MMASRGAKEPSDGSNRADSHRRDPGSGVWMVAGVGEGVNRVLGGGWCRWRTVARRRAVKRPTLGAAGAVAGGACVGFSGWCVLVGQKLSRTTCGARSTGQAPASRGPALPGAGSAPGAPPFCLGGGYLPRQIPFLRARHLRAQILRACAPTSACTQWKRSGCAAAQPNCRNFKKG